MSYKNTMKLFASNFTLVWKQVLYFLICLLIFTPITFACARPIIDIFRENDIFSQLGNTFSSFQAIGFSSAVTITELIKKSMDLIFSNFKDIFGNLMLVGLFGFVLPYIVLKISSYNLSSIFYKKLTMNMNVGYTQNLIQTLKYSIPYALMNLIYMLPLWTITILAVELYLLASDTILGIFIGLVCLSAFMIFINAVKHTIFSNYTAIYIEKECSVFIAFASSFSITIKNLWHILASSVVFHITVLVANSFVALFTFIAGLILMIPATFVLTAIFYEIIYLNKTGKRYYLGNNFIYNPVKYTVKIDEYADKMLNPEEPIEEQFVTSITSVNKNKSDIKNKK